MNTIEFDRNDDGTFTITVILAGQPVWVETVPGAEFGDAYSTLNTLYFS